MGTDLSGVGLHSQYAAVRDTIDPATRALVDKIVDLSDQRWHAATHDQLTHLLNRQGMRHTYANQRSVALLITDLDGFKAINDTYGPRAGDLLRQLVAKRLRIIGEPAIQWPNGQAARIRIVSARLGGDEFVVLATTPDEHAPFDRQDAEAFGRLIHRTIAGPYQFPGGPTIPVGASVGVTTTTGVAFEDSLELADAAMYRAKQNGGGVHVYNPHADNHAPRNERRQYRDAR